MVDHSLRYHRRSRILRSLAVGFALLMPVSFAASGATAQSTASNRTAELQQLVDDLAMQFQLTLRNRPDEHQSHYDHLADALAAWNRSARTDADLATMDNWLRAAIRATMPGSQRDMPSLPRFSTVATVPPPTTSTADPAETIPSPAVAESPAAPEVELATAVEPTAPAGARGAVSTPAEPDYSLEQHPAAANLTWGDPFVDDPLPTGAERVAMRTTRRKPARAAEFEVAINPAELNARLQGYHQGLSFIEAELIATASPTAFRLASLTREVESLQSQRELLEMYSSGASPAERRRIAEAPSVEEVVDLLQSRAEQRLAEVEDSTERSAAAERSVLAGVQRKLRQLATQ